VRTRDDGTLTSLEKGMSTTRGTVQFPMKWN
jgi:hypothetical protein